MLVNGELDELSALLGQLGELLEDGARAAIISFHSGEDRLVQHRFREDARLSVVTKRPLEASEQERSDNPRARSAKLRVAQRVARGDES